MKTLTNAEITVQQFKNYIKSDYKHFIHVEVLDIGEMKHVYLSKITFENCDFLLDFT